MRCFCGSSDLESLAVSGGAGRLTDVSSQAAATAQQNLTRVTDILSFHAKEQQPAAGAPPARHTSLVLGATALAYAAWESYVEQVAVEVVAFLSAQLSAAQVPTRVRELLAYEASPWDLTGDGWRREWEQLIHRRAYGDGSSTFGLNTAGPAQVIALFEAVGLEPFKNVRWQNVTVGAAKNRIAQLVKDRGTVVHTAQLPMNYGLNHVREHRDLVKRLVRKMDSSVSSQALALAGTLPW